MPRVPEDDDRREAGQRLKKALDGYFPRSRGGLRALADTAKIGPETLYRWFRGDSDPDLGTLARVATACGVTRTDLVAAMDGVVAPEQQEAPRPAWAEGLVDDVVGRWSTASAPQWARDLTDEIKGAVREVRQEALEEGARQVLDELTAALERRLRDERTPSA